MQVLKRPPTSSRMQVIGVIITQFILAYMVREWPWWKMWLAAYVLSATFNQNLLIAQHEISHFLAFKKPSYNKILALAANLPLIIPMAVKFREYHHDHHLFMVSDRWLFAYIMTVHHECVLRSRYAVSTPPPHPGPRTPSANIITPTYVIAGRGWR
jgi:hypothetical protein